MTAESARLRDVVDTIVTRESARGGCAVGVVQDGSVTFTHATGHLDAASTRPVTADSIFRIGSITKTLTALAVMQQVERGSISLDEPLSGRLRSIRVDLVRGAREITVRDVLTHTSGIGEVRRYRDFFTGPAWSMGLPPGAPTPDAPVYYRAGIRPAAPPGVTWAYSNHAAALLGQLIADVTGRPYAEYLRDEVLAPLGMTSTDVDLSRLDTARRAESIGPDGTPTTEQPLITIAAGAGWSSLADMSRFATALLAGGAGEYGSVVQPATLRQMFAPQFQPHPALPGQGLGFLRDQFLGHQLVWHDGAWEGYVASMLLVPDRGVATIALTNGSWSGAPAITHSLLAELLDESLGDRTALDAPPARPDLEGSYTVPREFGTNVRLLLAFGGTLVVTRTDDGVQLRSRQGTFREPLALVATADPYVFTGTVSVAGNDYPITLAFLTGRDGEVSGLSGHAMLPFALRRSRGSRDTTVTRALALAATVGSTAGPWLEQRTRHLRRGAS